MEKATLPHIATNQDLIFVSDNVFSIDALIELNELDLQSIDWKIAGYVPGGNNYFHNGFNKTFELTDHPDYVWLVSLLQEIATTQFKLIDADSTVIELVRAQMTYTVQDGRMRDADIHQDNNLLDSWSFLFYLLGDSGNTDFFTNMFGGDPIKTVEIKQYRLVIFPSVYAHRGHIPDSGDRLIANLVFNISTQLKDKILDKSSNAIQKMYKEKA